VNARSPRGLQTGGADSRIFQQLLERRRNTRVVRDGGGTAYGLRLGMKRVLVPLCLIGVAFSASTTLHLTPVLSLEGDDAIGTAITGNASFSSPTCVQSAAIATLQAEQDEVHSVVVDMPQVISLAYADPETWGSLPNWAPPDEPPPATPVLQVAMSVVGSSFSN
jgi:hypothetical protein